MDKYKVSFEFKNARGEWKRDCLSNNGNGFSLKDATDIAVQLSSDTVCEKRNILVDTLVKEESRVRECIYAYGERY